MGGVGGAAFGAARRRQAVLFAGVGLLVGACASSNQATHAPTPGPTSTATSAVDQKPLAAGTAATLVTGPSADAAALTVGLGAVDTVGGLITNSQKVTPFDVENPIINLLDPLLRKAIQDAARRSQVDGVALEITSGWRSRGFQQRLFDDAVRKYGSNEMAAQYVASPEVSKHVRGEAVDVGPVAADAWLMRNGAQFGLCQIYANEIWHFERVADAQGNCPPLRPNAAG